MVRKLIIALIAVVVAGVALAEPGGTYTLTGNEKNLAEIIKADMAAHPSLYKGENYNSYLKKFKSENKIGKRKLKPGDQLQFPETLTSLKHKKNEGALDVQDKPTIVIYIRERMDGGEVISKEFWSVVQERLNEAGYKTEVRFSTNELVDGDNFLCISFYSVWIRGVPLNTRIEYNKKNSKSKKMARVLRRYLDKQGVGPSELWPCDDSGVTTIVNDEEGDVEVPTDYPKMLFQDVPSVSIGLARAKIHELKEEYAVAILKAVNNYLD